MGKVNPRADESSSSRHGESQVPQDAHDSDAKPSSGRVSREDDLGWIHWVMKGTRRWPYQVEI